MGGEGGWLNQQSFQRDVIKVRSRKALWTYPQHFSLEVGTNVHSMATFMVKTQAGR